MRGHATVVVDVDPLRKWTPPELHTLSPSVILILIANKKKKNPSNINMITTISSIFGFSHCAHKPNGTFHAGISKDQVVLEVLLLV